MRTIIAATALTFSVLTAQSAVAQDISGAGQICLNTPSGPSLCNFQTMAQCRQARLPTSSSQCVDRSSVEGTVGSGSSSRSPTGPASPPVGDGGQR
jgi:hypothetical protein